MQRRQLAQLRARDVVEVEPGLARRARDRGWYDERVAAVLLVALDLGQANLEIGVELLGPVEDLLHLLLHLVVVARGDPGRGPRAGRPRRRCGVAPAVDPRQHGTVGDRLAGQVGQVSGLDDRLPGDEPRLLRAALQQEVVERLLVLEVELLLAPWHPEERRLRDVEVALLDHLRHLPVEEGEQQRADVAAVDVGVGHDDDAVVADLGDVVLLGADAAPSAVISVAISC